MNSENSSSNPFDPKNPMDKHLLFFSMMAMSKPPPPMPFFPPGFPPFPFMMPNSSLEKSEDAEKKPASPEKKQQETKKKIKIEPENKGKKPLPPETGENLEAVEEKAKGSEQNSVEDENLDMMDKKESIRKMLKYFMVNIGKIRSNRINAEREKYAKNPYLLQIFDLLMKKYIMSNKTKEEKIKYILRKAFKYLGTKLKREHLNDTQAKSKKEFDQIFNDFYMSEKTSLLPKAQEENENHEENQENILENKSNSKAAPKHKLIFSKESFNKTMNSDFLNTIFSKDSFVEDYKEFLSHFRDMSFMDNEDKLQKAVKKLASLKNLSKCSELSHRFFKRMPWLEIWIEEAEMIAKKLPEKNSGILLKNPNFKERKLHDLFNMREMEFEKGNSLKRKRANSL